MSRAWAIFLALHKKLDTYFAYLVAASTAAQAGWSDFEVYVPNKLRHWIIGTAAVIVFAGHIVKAVKDVDAMLTAQDAPPDASAK
jgi:hypothetical protein